MAYLKKKSKRQQAKQQNYKTLFLAILTISIFITACIVSLEIPPSTVFNYLFVSIILIICVIICAAMASFLLRYIKTHNRKSK